MREKGNMMIGVEVPHVPKMERVAGEGKPARASGSAPDSEHCILFAVDQYSSGFAKVILGGKFYGQKIRLEETGSR